jgi:MFS transporter, DHA1 family, multidrug resistance protein
MGYREFVIVIASIMALNPLAMDMMLPALPDIRSAFHIAAANRPQMVLSIFLVGFGAGQFVIGPLSDRFGRRPVLLSGMVVYGTASLLAIVAQSFENLLLARALQGLGTAATRVIATSIVRDCYGGHRMASVMSLAMMVFIAVPVVAPSIGQAIMLMSQWRGIFVVLMIYGVLALIWSNFRLPETLPEERRKSLAISEVLAAFRETVTNRQTLGYALAAGGVLGSLFAFMFSAQQMFAEFYGLRHYFPLAFAVIALGVAVAGFLNSKFVGRLGMRVISHAALLGFVAVAGAMLATARIQLLPLPLFMTLATSMMFSFGWSHKAISPARRRRCTDRSPPCLGSESGQPLARVMTARCCRSPTAFFSALWPRLPWSSWPRRAGCSSGTSSQIYISESKGNTRDGGHWTGLLHHQTHLALRNS